MGPGLGEEVKVHWKPESQTFGENIRMLSTDVMNGLMESRLFKPSPSHRAVKNICVSDGEREGAGGRALKQNSI